MTRKLAAFRSIAERVNLQKQGVLVTRVARPKQAHSVALDRS